MPYNVDKRCKSASERAGLPMDKRKKQSVSEVHMYTKL